MRTAVPHRPGAGMPARSGLLVVLLALVPAVLLVMGLVPIAPARSAEAVVHVSASATPGSGDGSSQSPYATLAEAIAAAPSGGTVEVAAGTYREGGLLVHRPLTIRAAEGASPVLTGAVVPTGWKAGAGGTWATPFDMVRLCTVCTTNADPAAEGMAAHPEQVFVDGRPLRQVPTRAEVTAETFFVDDPDPVALVQPGNRGGGYHVKPHRGVSYVIGVDPAAHEVEVVQQARALTLVADSVALEGMTVEKYSPVQDWDYEDPEIGADSGGAMVFAGGAGLRIEGNTFRYSAAATALMINGASQASITANRITDNGGSGVGINRSRTVSVEGNYWAGNNTAGFLTTDCGAYCTMADMKVTHSRDIRYAFNTVDYSHAPDHSTEQSWEVNRLPAIWFDEGVMSSQVVASRFVNTPIAVFDELSSGTTVASNIITGAGTGIMVAGSERTQVWNNTISHALTSISVYEDTRSDGCNARAEDGSCTAPESWSVSQGLAWDTVGTTIHNNILSSEQTGTGPDPWRFAAMLQVRGDRDVDGSSALYANDMVASINDNIYYRQDTASSTTVRWHYGADAATQTLHARSLAELSSSPHVTVDGAESRGRDLSGTRESNPVVVREPAVPTAWADYDLRVEPGGPADDTGAALPQEVAQALGITGSAPVDRGALVNVAWGDGPASSPAALAVTGAGAPQDASAQGGGLLSWPSFTGGAPAMVDRAVRLLAGNPSVTVLILGCAVVGAVVIARRERAS